MHRINTATADANANGPGKAGFRDRSGPDAPTQFNAAWCNAVQEAPAHVIEAMGIALVEGDNGQLLEAIHRILARRAIKNIHRCRAPGSHELIGACRQPDDAYTREVSAIVKNGANFDMLKSTDYFHNVTTIASIALTDPQEVVGCYQDYRLIRDGVNSLDYGRYTTAADFVTVAHTSDASVYCPFYKRVYSAVTGATRHIYQSNDLSLGVLASMTSLYSSDATKVDAVLGTDEAGVVCVAIGSATNFEILRTTDGSTFSIVFTGTATETSEAIHYLPDTDVWLVGTSERVLESTDGGATWTAVCATAELYNRSVHDGHSTIFSDSTTDAKVSLDRGRTWSDYRTLVGSDRVNGTYANKRAISLGDRWLFVREPDAWLLTGAYR